MTQYIHHGINTMLESFLACSRKKKCLLYTELSLPSSTYSDIRQTGGFLPDYI
jgi:hypothetical protein